MARLLSLIIILIGLSCSPGNNNSTYNSLSSVDKKKFDKYMILGEGIYAASCLNCHQQDGNGLHGIIPPLAQSDYLKLQQISIACLIKEGSKDTIIVNGISYLPQMPSHKFSNLELAEIITYINNTWGNEYGFVTVREIDQHLINCQ